MCKMWKLITCVTILAAGCASEESVQLAAIATPVQEELERPVYVPRVNTISTANPVARVNHAACKQVIMDGIQAEWVVVQDVRRSRTNDGYERIQVLVKNMTNSPIRTRFRFDWQNAKGVVVMNPDNNGWEKLTLFPGDDGVFTSIAPQKDCVDFRLRMKSIQ